MRIGLSAFAPTKIVTPVYGQTSLEILGSRLGGEEPINETSYYQYESSFSKQCQSD